MKLKFFPPFKDEGEVVAGWGQAELIRYLDGKVVLKGGTKEDRLAAHEWISLLWHEAVVGGGVEPEYTGAQAPLHFLQPTLFLAAS
jgi:hypothetical protein